MFCGVKQRRKHAQSNKPQQLQRAIITHSHSDWINVANPAINRTVKISLDYIPTIKNSPEIHKTCVGREHLAEEIYVELPQPTQAGLFFKELVAEIKLQQTYCSSERDGAPLFLSTSKTPFTASSGMLPSNLDNKQLVGTRQIKKSVRQRL